MSFVTRALRGSRSLVLFAALLPACAEAPPPSAVAPAPVASAPAVEARPARPAPYGSRESLASAVDAYASAFGQHWGEAYAFSGYVAIAHHGEIVFGKGYGAGSREGNGVADADTRFRIGSLTKQLTAVAVMQLVERKKAGLTDPVSTYVPGLSAATGAVTLHQLLTHTSGIPSYTDDEALMKSRDRAHTPAEVLATFKDRPLAFTPGEKFAYSNSNYFLLGLVIERASGQSYEAFMQASLFRAAGMTRTSTVDAPDAPNTAPAFSVLDEKRVPAHATDMSVPFAAGALRSTARDLVAWDRALAGDVLLSPASKAKLFTPEKDDYAYGVIVSKRDGHTVHAHSGGIDGFSSFLSRVPDEDLAVVVLSNSDGFPAAKIAFPTLGMALTGKAVPPQTELEVAPMDGALVARAVGEYQLTPETRAAFEKQNAPPAVIAALASVAVTREGDRLFAKPAGQGKFELVRAANGELFSKKVSLRVIFDASPRAGEPSPGVSIVQGGETMRFVRGAAAKASDKTAVDGSGRDRSVGDKARAGKGGAGTGALPSKGPGATPAKRSASK